MRSPGRLSFSSLDHEAPDATRVRSGEGLVTRLALTVTMPLVYQSRVTGPCALGGFPEAPSFERPRA
jgi:hypothetical protein